MPRMIGRHDTGAAIMSLSLTPSRLPTLEREHPLPEPQHQQGLTVLVIERDPGIRDMLRWYFHLNGHTSHTLFPDSSVCWKERMRDAPPHLILLDVSRVQEVTDFLSR